jgi:hypothetical protein
MNPKELAEEFNTAPGIVLGFWRQIQPPDENKVRDIQTPMPDMIARAIRLILETGELCWKKGVEQGKEQGRTQAFNDFGSLFSSPKKVNPKE